MRNSVDLVVRITCDDPFKDLDSIYNMISAAIANNLDLVTNEISNTKWVVGTTAEIYSTQLLRYLYFNAWTSYQREHIQYENIFSFKPFPHGCLTLSMLLAHSILIEFYQPLISQDIPLL